MRLIDADALAKVKFHGYPEIEITPSDVNAEAYKRGWNDAIDAIIESEPSIDAVPMEKWQELKETVLELRDNGGMATQKEVSGFLLNLMDVLDGEDVDAVLTARWIGGEIGHCSCCGHYGCASDIWSGCDGDRFCPNCGARMDGKES